MLLFRRRSRLFGFDPLSLRLLLLLVGDLELIGHLLAKPRNQKLRRQCRVAELDFLDNDSRPQPFGSDRILACSSAARLSARSKTCRPCAPTTLRTIDRMVGTMMLFSISGSPPTEATTNGHCRG